jgi:hypothetical protein
VSKLRISEDLSLPLDWVMMATVVYGSRGAGKTTFGSVVAEEVTKQGVRFCAIDVKGDWWGLKGSADGKSAGIPVVIFGGEHQDLPLEENAGAQVADIVATLAQSCILDLEPFSKGKQIRFLGDFFERLYHVNRDPLLVLADEIQRYAPQKPISPEHNVCLGAVEDVVKLGRRHGLGIIGFTQRGSGLNKEVSELCDVLTAFRTPGPLDQDRVRGWLEANVTEIQRDAVMASIAGLPTGTCIIASGHPDLKVFRTITIRRRETFDSSATPSVGKKRREPKVLAKPDLEKLRGQMAEAIERAKQEDPRELRRQIADLRKQLAAKPAPAPAPPLAPAQAVPKTVERSVLKAADAKRLEMAAARIGTAGETVRSVADSLLQAIAKATAPPPQWTLARPIPPPVVAAQARRIAHRATPDFAGDRRAVTQSADEKLGGAERKILSALAHYPHGKTKRELGVLTGYAHAGGGFNNAIGRLRTLGYVNRGEPIQPTQEGLDALGPVAALPSGADLRAYWFSQLGRAERCILQVLCEVYPGTFTKEQVGEQAARYNEGKTYEPNGGGFNNAIGRLRTLELVRGGRDALRASETLFEEVPA